MMKIMMKFQEHTQIERRTNGRTEGPKDVQTLFYRTLQANAGIQKCIMSSLSY